MTEGQQESAGQQRDNSSGVDELVANDLVLVAPVFGTPAAAEIVPLHDSKGLQEQVRLLHAELINEHPALAARWGAVLLRLYRHTLHREGPKRTKSNRAAQLVMAEKAVGRVMDRPLILDIARRVPCDEKVVRAAIKEVERRK